jgi:hypothetical protein
MTVTVRWAIAIFAITCGAQAQQPIGTVGVQDATVAGALEVTNGRAILVGNTTVTARDHSAEVALNRGGSVLVCSTSALHLTSGKNGADASPLMLSLDRGAFEVHMAASPNDVVMTPDLRFTMRGQGPLDLRIRVTRNGDTCVENRGLAAPTLNIASQFGEATYELRAQQHVLFEHGSLKEVVDSESTSCGCPQVPVVSVADAGVTSSTPAAPGSTTGGTPAEQQHPFPAAVSAGLAPPAEVPQTPPGVIHTQVSTTLTFDAAANGGAPPSAGAPSGETGGNSTTATAKATTPAPVSSSAASAETATAQAPPPPAPPSATDVVHKIGRFFKRLFGGG